MRRYDLMPAAFAFSNFGLNHPALGLSAPHGVENEHAEEMNGQHDTPDQWDERQREAKDACHNIDDQR